LDTSGGYFRQRKAVTFLKVFEAGLARHIFDRKQYKFKL
jgi:hypothetical protein